MANADTPMGFVPFRHKGGGTIRTQEFRLASGAAVNLFRGDAVILSSGKVTIAADNSATILGIFESVQYTASDGSPVFAPNWVTGTATLGSADAIAHVYADPNITFKVQTDTDTAFAIASHVGNSYDIELDHAGSTATGQSGMELDLNDAGSTQFTVIGLIDEPGNEVGANAKVEVFINVPAMG